MASPAGPVVNTLPIRSSDNTNSASTQNARGGPRDGNRNRSQGGQRGNTQARHRLAGSIPQQSRGKGGRPRGRGDMNGMNLQGPNGNRVADLPGQPGPPLDPPPGPGGGGSFGVRLTKDAITREGEGVVDEQAKGEEDEAELCFICASPVVHSSVGPCNHRTCHICALRLRALYKTRACAHCRVSNIPT
jgi:hypothetical protein